MWSLLHKQEVIAMENTNEKYRKHLNIDQRKMIERYLYERKSFSFIAEDLGVCPSTVYREVKRNRRCEGVSHAAGADRNDCEHLKGCKIRGACGLITFDGHCDLRYCRCCNKTKCIEYCQEYKKRTCKTVLRAPFVCNGCDRFNRCTIDRFIYSAQNAQSNADWRNSEARRGIDMTKDEVKYLIDTVRAGLSLGHSIHHIFSSNSMPCSERTFYRLVENESIALLSIELAKKVKYKRRKHKSPKQSHPRGFYTGHEHKAYLEVPLSVRMATTEIDTVWGSKKDRKCILSLHRIDLHFQIYLLLETRTKEAVVDALDWLEECSNGHFSEYFGLLLADRGSEFDDIDGIERSIDGTSKRADVFFTDPSRPDQKGSAEKNHVELRKIISKGTSLRKMDPHTLATICSHVNSTVRKGCGNTTPMHLAMLCLPKVLLDNLGLSLIPANEVIAAPGILYDPTK
jgi:IS30 family transposase